MASTQEELSKYGMQIYKGTNLSGQAVPGEYVLRESGGFGQIGGQRSLLGFDPAKYGLDPNSIQIAPQTGSYTSKGDTSFDKVLSAYRGGESNTLAMQSQERQAVEYNRNLKASGFTDVPATPLSAPQGAVNTQGQNPSNQADIANLQGALFDKQAQLRALQKHGLNDISQIQMDAKTGEYYPTKAAQYPSQANDISKNNQQAFEAAKNSGITSPSDRSGANDMFNQFSFSQQASSGVDNFISQDPYLNTVISGYQQYMSQQNQRTSLVDTYKSMLEQSGIQGIDTDLINMKNVIEGTEDDIRNEVTKAGGFATDSQVMALSNARNKQLIKNYNNLLETRNSKEKYLDTMLNLTQQDRQEADARFESQMNFGFKIAEVNQQMKQNAISTLDRTAQTIGWDGIFNSTQGNPQLQRQIEAIYGLPQGGLYQAAQRAFEERAAIEQERELGLQDRELGIKLKEQGLKSGELDMDYRRAQIAKLRQEISGNGVFDGYLDETEIKKIDQSPQGKKVKALGMLKQKVEGYKALVKKYGTEVRGKQATELESSYADLKIAYKEAANLGALTGPDVALLQEAIKPATSSGIPYVPFSKTFGRLGMVLSGGGKGSIISGLDQTLSILNKEAVSNIGQLYARDKRYPSSFYIQEITNPFNDVLQLSDRELQSLIKDLSPEQIQELKNEGLIP